MKVQILTVERVRTL